MTTRGSARTPLENVAMLHSCTTLKFFLSLSASVYLNVREYQYIETDVCEGGIGEVLSIVGP